MYYVLDLGRFKEIGPSDLLCFTPQYWWWLKLGVGRGGGGGGGASEGWLKTESFLATP